MEVLDQLFGKKTEEKVVVDTNTQEVEENAEKNDGEILAPEEAVAEPVSEGENLTTCEKCDLQPETCEEELGTKCTQVEVPENAELIEEPVENNSKTLAKEIISVLDSTPSTDFELVNLKCRLYSIVSRFV